MNIAARALIDRRLSLAWWTTGVVVYCILIVAVWPVIDGNDEFADLYADLPEAFQAMFGSDGFADFGTPTGFLNTYLYSLILPFIFSGLAINLGASLLAGEEEDGLLDLVLSYPIERRRLVIEKVVALAGSMLSLGLITVMVLAVAREPVGLDIGIWGLSSATLGSAMFAIGHGMVAFVIGASTGKKSVATGTTWGIVIAGYLASILANLVESLDALLWVSPLSWATTNDAIAGELPTSYLTLTTMSLVLVAATVAMFERHDLT